MDWFNRFGKWYFEIWLSEKLLIEIGFGGNDSSTTNEVYQVNTKRLWFMYITIAKPTLKYLIQDEKIIKNQQN